MRHILGVAAVSVSLALSASAALASDGFDYSDRHPVQMNQSEKTGNSMTPKSPQVQLTRPATVTPFTTYRGENFEGGR
jgi:hypothetical protein